MELFISTCKHCRKPVTFVALDLSDMTKSEKMRAIDSQRSYKLGNEIVCRSCYQTKSNLEVCYKCGELTTISAKNSTACSCNADHQKTCIVCGQLVNAEGECDCEDGFNDVEDRESIDELSLDSLLLPSGHENRNSARNYTDDEINYTIEFAA